MKSFYSEFVSELKLSDPGKWYAQAKKIGAFDLMAQGDIKVESLAGFSNLQSANIIAQHFAACLLTIHSFHVFYLRYHLPRCLSMMST